MTANRANSNGIDRIGARKKFERSLEKIFDYRKDRPFQDARIPRLKVYQGVQRPFFHGGPEKITRFSINCDDSQFYLRLKPASESDAEASSDRSPARKRRGGLHLSQKGDQGVTAGLPPANVSQNFAVSRGSII